MKKITAVLLFLLSSGFLRSLDPGYVNLPLRTILSAEPENLPILSLDEAQRLRAIWFQEQQTGTALSLQQQGIISVRLARITQQAVRQLATE